MVSGGGGGGGGGILGVCPGGGHKLVLGVEQNRSLSIRGGGGGGGNLQVCPPGGGDIINAKCVSRVFKYIYIY